MYAPPQIIIIILLLDSKDHQFEDSEIAQLFKM